MLYGDERDKAINALGYLKEPFHFNKFPEPYFPATEDEFWEYYTVWAPQVETIGQLFRAEELRKLDCLPKEYHKEHSSVFGPMASVNYFFFSDRAYARVWWGGSRTKNVAWYRLGCEHSWEELSRDKFEYKCRCKKCGIIRSFQTGY